MGWSLESLRHWRNVTCDGSDKCPSYSVNVSGFASFFVAGRRISGAMRNFCKVVLYILTMRAVYVLLNNHIQIKLFFELKKGWLGGIPQ